MVDQNLAMPASYDGAGSSSPQWWPSRYGPSDTLGSGNELNTARTLSAVGLVREGRVLELAQLTERGGPALAPREYDPLILAHGMIDPALVESECEVGWFEERVEQPYHIGCHLDGLGHIAIAGRFYNGAHYSTVFSPRGLTRYGIEGVRPWVCRGVLLDIAGLLGDESLPEGFVITPEHLQASCDRQAVQVEAGDAVLLHTGWGGLWETDGARYAAAEPGAGWDAAHWLTERRVSLVGADNWSFEVLPGENADRPFVVHQHLLAETGTHILENARTAELAQTARSEFLFVLALPKTVGTTAGMAAPLAVL